MKKYEQYRSSMKTGDVIAFSGKGRVSQIIKWKTQSEFSHVGIIMGSDMGGGIGQTVLLIESTTLGNLPDSKTGEIIKGVQMHFLSKRLGSYNGDAWWIPLKKELEPHQAYNMQKWLRQKHGGRIKYDALQAIGAGADLFDWIPGIANEPDFSSLFCSELVTRALQIAGVVDDEINASEQTPADVANYECFENEVKL